MDSRDIRQKFIDFYLSKNHKEIAPAPLLAENDPTLLFVNSGMFPLVPYLLGESHPAGKRLTNYQRSFRSDDIEEVGDRRHTTFFEMLGNWSLGDYFKAEQLTWWYEFLVEVLKLDPNKLYQSVFAGNDLVACDDESIKTLQTIFTKYQVGAGVGLATTGKGELGAGREIDFKQDRIFPYIDKNWWKRGDVVGEPGGPDSETFYDTGRPHDKKYGEHCHINCDCGRFIEIGNSVFMQYRKTATSWEELVQKNVDFGGGLERLAMATSDNYNVFKTDVFSDYIIYLEEASGKKYEDLPASFEIIADHVRAATFLIADGGVPSNKDQGYFIRRLIRRGLVHLQKLGVGFADFVALARLVVKKMSPIYPHLKANELNILNNLTEEVEKFSLTLEKGVKYFEKIKPINKQISGEDIFNLFTAFGFPPEITRELAHEKGYTIDEADFAQRLTGHKELSRQGAEQKFKSGLADTSEATIKLHTATHLLHQALRQVLGDHVAQKGSNITPERLRFDFSHPQKLTAEEIKQVEAIVNEQINKKLPVYCEEATPDSARQHGAIGLFNDKYGAKVKVYSIGSRLMDDVKPFSREMCSGPHVNNLSELGQFKIQKEEACSAGVRRIKAILV